MIDLVLRVLPEFKNFEEAPIHFLEKLIGWHSSVMTREGVAASGGCSADRNVARRIALAELIERYTFKQNVARGVDALILEEFPTSSGFAAGFESTPTKMRAVCEAVERWAISKWIDDGHYLPPISSQQVRLSPLAKFFASKFDQVLFFSRSFEIDVDGQQVLLKFGTVIGINDGGAFPGSRVCSPSEDTWEHALIEAWRHLGMASNKKKTFPKNDFYYDRVFYFARNAQAALDSVNQKPEQITWPEPRLRLLAKVEHAVPEGFYVWRALCHDFIGWHLGDKTRFVY